MCTLLCTCFNYIGRKDTYQLQNILQIAMPPHLAKDIWNQTLPMPFRDYLLNPLSGEKIVLQLTSIYIDVSFMPDIVPTPSATFSHEVVEGSSAHLFCPKAGAHCKTYSFHMHRSHPTFQRQNPSYPTRQSRWQTRSGHNFS